MEKVSGQSYDEDRLRTSLELSSQAEDDLVWVLESAKNRPSPTAGANESLAALLRAC